MRYNLGRRAVLKTSVAAVSGVALAGCSGDDGTDSTSRSNDDGGDSDGGDIDSSGMDSGEQEGDSPDVTILEHELVESDPGDAHVEGKVENNES